MSDEAALLLLHPIVIGRRVVEWLDLPAYIAPDLPGHGARGVPRADLTLGEIADEIAGWVHRPMHVVGALMGGTIGLHLALRHPALVRSLLVADTSARTDHVRMRQRADGVLAGDRQLDWTLERWFGRATMASDPLPEPAALARDALAAMPLPALAAAWRAMADHDVMAELLRITVPVTVVGGTHDVVHPPAEQEALASALPNARLALIDAHHMAPLDNPTAFSETVRDHIAWAEANG